MSRTIRVGHLDGVPLIAVGPMWSELVAWARRFMVDGQLELASPPDMGLVHCVDSVEEALDLIREHRRGRIPTP